MILSDEFKLCHPLHNILLLFEASLNHTGIDFLFKDKLEIIIRISLMIPDEVEMVERTDQSCPELLKLTIYPLFYVAESHI